MTPRFRPRPRKGKPPKTWQIQVSAGSYRPTGRATTLIQSPRSASAPPTVVDGDAGSYAVTGRLVSLLKGTSTGLPPGFVAGDSGSYRITGNAALLVRTTKSSRPPAEVYGDSGDYVVALGSGWLREAVPFGR